MNKPKKLSPKELVANNVEAARQNLRITEECSPDDDVRDEQVKDAKTRLARAEAELKAYEPDRKSNSASDSHPPVPAVTTPKPPVTTAKQPFPPLRKGASGLERAQWAAAKAQHDKENK